MIGEGVSKSEPGVRVLSLIRLLVGRDDFAVDDFQVGHIGGELEFFTVFGIFENVAHRALQRRRGQWQGADLAGDRLKIEVAVLCAEFAFELKRHVFAVHVKDDVGAYVVVDELDLYIFHLRANLLDLFG